VSGEPRRQASSVGGERPHLLRDESLDHNRPDLPFRASPALARALASPAFWLTLLFTLLTVTLTWPLPRVLTTSVPGDFGDPLFISWVMTWVAGKLSAALTSPWALGGFWDAPIFHPEPGALAFSEHFVPQTVLVLPVYWLTGNPILCYNLAFLLSYVLTGVGTALLTRALTGSVAAAVVAGVVAAFNEYRLVWEVAHLQTLSIYWFPFVLYGIERYFATGRRGALALAALSWAALNLSSVYYLAYCAPFIVAFAAIEMVRYRLLRDGRTWRDLIAGAAAMAVVTLPFLLPYAAMQQRMGFARTALEIITHSATLDNYRAALPRLLVPLSLALVAVAAAAAGLVRRTRATGAGSRAPRLEPLVAALALHTIAAVWLSLGPVVQSGGQQTDWPALYPLLTPLPGYAGLRVPARLAAIFLVLLGVLAGCGLAALARRSRMFGAALAAVAVIVFLWQGRHQRVPLDQPLPSAGLGPAPAYLAPAPELPPIYRSVADLPATTVLVEFPFGDQWYDVRYMYFAALHRRPLLNGYSGVFPPSYRARQGTLWRPPRDPDGARASLTGATHAIVHTAAWRDGYGQQVVDWLEKSEGAQLIAAIDGARLYVLR
jgi:hypothetical protein